jgi:adenine deaminase
MDGITANFVDITNRNIFHARLHFTDTVTRIEHIAEGENPSLPFLLPGFIDAHVHIESSMLIPSEFARLAVTHGTVATISDPHEIANVCGMNGVYFMIRNGRSVPFKFHFGAPSCVPATQFETAGAVLNSDDVKTLLEDPSIYYLSEMMNFPGALHGDPEVLKKIASAHALGKPVDGHAPGLRGDDAKNYIARGISTDHECFTYDEAFEKLQYGMKIIIREGSAAKNFEALIHLLQQYPDMIMFGSDDKHPDELADWHINKLCARAVAKGIDLFHVLQAACVNPVLHYKMQVGQLREGDAADFILVNNLRDFDVLATYIDGQLVAENGVTKIARTPSTERPNTFNRTRIELSALGIPANGQYPFPIIEALDGQLITNAIHEQPAIEHGQFVSDPSRDLLKIVVVNRYTNAPIAKAFIKNFGIKQGAIASSVAHDSHNIVAVGTDDESLCKAINLVIDHQGGVSCIKHNLDMVVPLPIAGLMSDDDGYKVAELYAIIDEEVKKAGSTLRSPFMTLSFMALLVIPALKLSDLGLFDGNNFTLLERGVGKPGIQ